MISEIRAQGQHVAKVSEQVDTLPSSKVSSRQGWRKWKLKRRISGQHDRSVLLRTGVVLPVISATASSAFNRPVLDDFQLVFGGWREAKKSDLEGEIRHIFAQMKATPLLHDMHIPFVRSMRTKRPRLASPSCESVNP